MPDPFSRQTSPKAGPEFFRGELAELETLVRQVLLEDPPKAAPRRTLRQPSDPASSTAAAAETIIRRIRDIGQMSRSLSDETLPEDPLEKRRRRAADTLLESHDFGAEVEGYKSWTADGDEWSIEVFLSGSSAESQCFLQVDFPPGSATPWSFTHRKLLPPIEDTEPMP